MHRGRCDTCVREAAGADAAALVSGGRSEGSSGAGLSQAREQTLSRAAGTKRMRSGYIPLAGPAAEGRCSSFYIQATNGLGGGRNATMQSDLRNAGCIPSSP